MFWSPFLVCQPLCLLTCAKHSIGFLFMYNFHFSPAHSLTDFNIILRFHPLFSSDSHPLFHQEHKFTCKFCIFFHAGNGFRDNFNEVYMRNIQKNHLRAWNNSNAEIAVSKYCVRRGIGPVEISPGGSEIWPPCCRIVSQTKRMHTWLKAKRAGWEQGQGNRRKSQNTKNWAQGTTKGVREIGRFSNLRLAWISSQVQALLLLCLL